MKCSLGGEMRGGDVGRGGWNRWRGRDGDDRKAGWTRNRTKSSRLDSLLKCDRG